MLGLFIDVGAVRKVSKVVEESSCPKDQYHQAAVCFCGCTVESYFRMIVL